MSGLLQAELLKLGKRPAVRVLLAVLAATLALFGYVLPYLVASTEDVQVWGDGRALTPGELRAMLLPQSFVAQALTGLVGMGAAVALILGVLAAGSEYRWGTGRTLATLGPSRLAVGGGKVVGLGLVLLGFVLVTMAVALGCSFAIAAREGAPIALPTVGTVLAGLGAGWLVLVSWSAFGTLLAVALRGTGLATGLGLVYPLVVEPLVQSLPLPFRVGRVLQQALLGGNSAELVLHFGRRWPGAVATPAWQAALVLAGYTAVFLVLAGLVFRRRDIT